MARNPRHQDAALTELYAQIPVLHCRGLCSDCCGPIEMSVRERRRIEEVARPVTCGVGASCSMLTGDRRCSVYALRPVICRLWGTVRSMRCHYGCRPERWLSEEEGVRILAQADIIGGHPGGRERRLREVLTDYATLADVAAHVLRHSQPARLDGRAAAMPRRTIDR